MDAKGLAGRSIKEAAALADRVAPPRPGVVVLLYHRVGERSSASEIDMPAAVFEQQMAWLAARRVATDLDAALDETAEPFDERRPRHPVVVTFDDGTADLIDVALPILARHNVPSVWYLATDFLEQGRDFPDRGRPLSWAGAREAVDSGLVTLGSHTHTHALLDRIDPVDAAGELDRSVELIGERVGVTVDHFAYPKAVAPSPEVEPLVRTRFRSAALGGNRANGYGSTDLHRLARSVIQRRDGMRFFTHKARGGMALEEAARRRFDRLRYARAAG
ncbi:MAG TPA: polysaccharide deacetylase family protein [Acidimicrobiales bacterium]|nr:polysaccharide deacetylase family protein [Acidimicrobiales bacterium]